MFRTLDAEDEYIPKLPKAGVRHIHKRFCMRPPAPNVTGDTPAERMSNALRMVLSVSKADLLKKEGA